MSLLQVHLQSNKETSKQQPLSSGKQVTSALTAQSDQKKIQKFPTVASSFPITIHSFFSAQLIKQLRARLAKRAIQKTELQLN